MNWKAAPLLKSKNTNIEAQYIHFTQQHLIHKKAKYKFPLASLILISVNYDWEILMVD